MNKRSYRAYRSWDGMKQRCLNPNTKAAHIYYKTYIDPNWLTFEGFLKDMGERPVGRYSIDRIDPTKGYYKENCRWLLLSENCRLGATTHGLSYTKKYQYNKTHNWRLKKRGITNGH